MARYVTYARMPDFKGVILGLALVAGLVCAQARAATPWNHSDRAYRVQVTLNAYVMARIDTPLFVRLESPEAGQFVDTGSVLVDETTVPALAAPVSAAAWSQPSGRVAEAHFAAPGTTAGGAERTFHIYFNLGPSPAPWAWGTVGAENWGAYEDLDRNSNGTDDAIRIESESLVWERSWSESTGKLERWIKPGKSVLGLLSPSWTPVHGYSNAYCPQTATQTYGQVNPESLVAPSSVTRARDAKQIALSFRFDDLTPPGTHAAEETYRMIRGLPLCEFVMTVAPGTEDFTIDSSSWCGRYLNIDAAAAGFDHLITDTGGDVLLHDGANRDTRWLIAYSVLSNRSVGFFRFLPGNLRSDTGGEALYDTYGSDAEPDNTFRYLWAVSTSPLSLKILFESMAADWQVGAAEGRDATINQPAEGQLFFAGDTLPLEIATPSGTSGLTAKWIRGDASEIPVALTDVGGGVVWEAQTPYIVQESDAFGTWTLVVENNATIKERQILVTGGGTHPRLLFSASDIPDLQARRTTTHADDWNGLLDICEDIRTSSDPDPSPSLHEDIRIYYDYLLSLALVQKIDPSQPYEAKMWEFFWTMLNYSHFQEDPIWGSESPIVTRFIFALTLTYDWHYESLTSAERHDVRGKIIDYTTRALDDLWYLRHEVETEPEDVDDYLSSLMWLCFASVQAVTCAFEDEMDESLRQEWLRRVDQGLTNVLKYLPDDGASPMGTPYHSAGLIHMWEWSEVRRTGLGISAAELYEADPWFANTSLYTLYSILPGGGSDNYGGVARFGDARPYHYHTPLNTQPVLAARLGNPITQALATQTQYPIDTYNRKIWRFLFYDPTVPVGDPADLANWRTFEDTGIFAWRSGWDNDATYFSLKSGMHATSHAHPDDGTFILHRAGVPYIIDLGYSFKKQTDEHNVLMVNDTGQRGAGAQWYSTVDEAYWGGIDHVLATGVDGGEPGDFFDVLCDPGPMYSNSSLTGWKREAVGLGDLFLIRDEISASSSLTYDLLIHAGVTDADDPAYDYATHRTENPWTTLGDGSWRIDARNTSPEPPNLIVTDLSASSWSAAVEPSMYVPEKIPGSWDYNSSFNYYQSGSLLKRSRAASAATSLVALGFDDQTAGWDLAAWVGAGAEGLRATSGGADVLAVLWPVGGSCSDSDGWDVNGAMVGHRYADKMAYFARSATLVRDRGTTLLTASQAVSLYANMEHAPAAQTPNTATIHAGGACSVTLYCPNEPGVVKLNGAPVSFVWIAQQLTVSPIAAGEYALECVPGLLVDTPPIAPEDVTAEEVQS